MHTNDHIYLKDNMRLILGDSEASDSYLEFNGTNLRFFDSALNAVKTLSQLASATAPSLDDAYNNDPGGERTVVVDAGDISFDLNDATNDYKVVIDNITAGAIADGLVIASTGVGSSIVDGIDASAAGLTNALNVGANTILGTTAVIDFTNFDVDGSGNLTIGGNLSVGGTWAVNIIAAAAAGGSLTLDGNATGGVNIGGVSTGAITLSANVLVASGKSITLAGAGGSNILDLTAGDVRVIDGSITITDADNAPSLSLTNNTITTGDLIDLISTSLTTGKGIKITANGVTSGSILYLETSAAGFTGKFIQLYDGAADDFSVGLDGATIIAGNAAGTDALTITAGDVQITSGYIDIDAGKIEVDSATNLGSYFKRNQGVTTVPVLEIETTNAADDQPCLLIDHNATGAVDAIDIENAGTGYGLNITGQAAGSGGLRIDVADSTTGRVSLLDLGPWLGTANQGALEIVSDAAVTIPAGQILRINQQGTGQHAGAISGTLAYLADEATAPAAGTSYAIYLKATNIEALHVDAGRCLFDEGIDLADSGTLRLGAGNDVSLTSDGTNVHGTLTGFLTLGDGGTTNYVKFDASTGLISLVGTARVTKKVFIPADSFSVHTGSVALTQVGTGSAKGYAFDSAADESVTSFWVVPGNWASATNVTIRLHWVANAAAGACIWDVYSLKVASGETVDGAGDLDSVTTTTAGTANLLNISSVTVAAAEFAAGDIVIVRVGRDADNAADTLAVDAILVGIEIQYTASAI